MSDHHITHHAKTDLNPISHLKYHKYGPPPPPSNVFLFPNTVGPKNLIGALPSSHAIRLNFHHRSPQSLPLRDIAPLPFPQDNSIKQKQFYNFQAA